jgi:hypothetical protein
VLRDEVRRYVVEALGDEAGVLVVDETGFLKKAHIRSAWHGNIPARRVGSKIVRSGCSCVREPLGPCLNRSAALSPPGLGRGRSAPREDLSA